MTSKSKDQLERDKLTAEARKATLEGDQIALQIEELQRGMAWMDARTGEAPDSLTYYFDHEVNLISVRDCMHTLTLWGRRHPGQPFKVIFNSPGGRVIDGLALYDFLMEMRAQGHSIETVALGMAASMAGILLQAGDNRVVGAHSWMLIHEVSTGSIGTTSEMEDAVKFTRRLQNKLLDILCTRSTVTRATIAKNWKKSDWWLDAEDMLKYGFADEVRA